MRIRHMAAAGTAAAALTLGIALPASASDAQPSAGRSHTVAAHHPAGLGGSEGRADAFAAPAHLPSRRPRTYLRGARALTGTWDHFPLQSDAGPYGRPRAWALTS